MSNRGRTYYARILSKDPCVFCGNVETKRTLEHIHPKSAGGSNHWLNLASSCPKCNTRKSNSSLLGFLLTRKLTKAERRQFNLIPSFTPVDDWELPERWHSPVTDLLVPNGTK